MNSRPGNPSEISGQSGFSGFADRDQSTENIFGNNQRSKIDTEITKVTKDQDPFDDDEIERMEQPKYGIQGGESVLSASGADMNYTVEEYKNEGLGGYGKQLVNDEDTQLVAENKDVKDAWANTQQKNQARVTRMSNVFNSQQRKVALKKLTISEKLTENEYADKFLEMFAYPFAHETGLYFKGRREYTLPACGVCSACLAIFVIACWFILFVPVMSGAVRSSELKVGVLSTPGGVPLNLNTAGYVSSGPSYLAQFFGQQVVQEAPKLDVPQFVTQFKTIEVIGANQCNNKEGKAFLTCSLDGNADIIKTDCTASKLRSSDIVEFGMEKVAIFRLSVNTAKVPTNYVDFPKEGKLVCHIDYDKPVENPPDQPDQDNDPDALLVRTVQHESFRYDPEAGEIKTKARDSGDRYSRVMRLRKGHRNALQVRVDEVREAQISGTGSDDVTFQAYFSEESYVVNPPFYADQTKTEPKATWLYAGQIEFVFGRQYAYNNQISSLIDALEKFGFVLVFVYCIILIGRLIVRVRFYEDLREVIARSDHELHAQAGLQALGGKQGAHARWAHQLGFRALFSNAMLLERHEAALSKAEEEAKDPGKRFPQIAEQVVQRTEAQEKLLATVKGQANTQQAYLARVQVLEDALLKNKMAAEEIQKAKSR